MSERLFDQEVSKFFFKNNLKRSVSVLELQERSNYILFYKCGYKHVVKFFSAEARITKVGKDEVEFVMKGLNTPMLRKDAYGLSWFALKVI